MDRVHLIRYFKQNKKYAATKQIIEIEKENDRIWLK